MCLLAFARPMLFWQDGHKEHPESAPRCPQKTALKALKGVFPAGASWGVLESSWQAGGSTCHFAAPLSRLREIAAAFRAAPAPNPTSWRRARHQGGGAPPALPGCLSATAL